MMRGTFVNSVGRYAASSTPIRQRTHSRLARLALSMLAMTLMSLGVTASHASAAASPSQLSTFVEPSAGFGFLGHAILGAKHTIDLSMYEFEDPTLESNLVARARAGVDVRVVLDSEYGIANDNEPAAKTLERGGVHVVFAPDNQIFHAKYLVIDGTSLYIGTANFQAQYYSSTRDFWVLDRSRADIAAAQATFSADFAHRSAPLSTGSGDLVWSPGSTNNLVNLIESAKHSLLVENEEMDSYTIESALEAAANRGVDVEVVMTYDSEWHSALSELASAGVHVHTLSESQVYIHAKVICADCIGRGGTVFVGSENFSTSSLDYNRELGIITSVTAVVNTIRSTVESDYAQGTSRF
jgi:phosphatidylserine/phosphatidylglycerophosphate/cardiolipin synthase-like enzyme